MSNDVYTPKQKALVLRTLNNDLKRTTLLEGSVSSGKTHVSLIMWAFMVGQMPEGKLYLMLGRTLTTLKNNCLYPLQDMVGSNNFTFSISTKEATLFGRKVLLEGANDKRAEHKIRGLTLQAAYGDEVTLFSEELFAMLLSRLRLPGAKLITTTNPDHPRHWLKKNYIDAIKDRDLDMEVIKFLVDDNTFLPKTYVDNLKKDYVGVFYDRFVMGEWVAAEGGIYLDYSNSPQSFEVKAAQVDKSKITQIILGVDFGGTGSATTFVATAYLGYESIVVLEAKRIDSKTLDPEILGNKFVRFADRIIREWGWIDYAYCDNAESILIRGLSAAVDKAYTPVTVMPAKKTSINGRILFTQMMMRQGRFKMTEYCSTLGTAFSEAMWENSDKKGTAEDKRLDDGTSDIDTLDAFEYTVEREIRNFIDYIKGGEEEDEA